ncbi:MAG TPA: Ig-like domain-containing protein [Candidatus Dormibacteraeota bacterium]|nr:Ig-like domain-containing protein [Candidatus Dormibacteraeota bacterium]
MRSWRKLAGLSLMAGALLISSVFGAAPAMAGSDDNNKGDMWTQPYGTPEETSGHSQEVHLPCGPVDLWGDALSNTSGNWILYHQPPPNDPGPGTVLASGPYAYSGDESMRIATIPMADLMKNTGPHFKVELENENSKWKTFWLDCKVAINTVPDPATATVGQTLNDTATVSQGFTPTGTLTFTLYDPSNANVYSKSVAVDGNGSYATNAGFVANTPGAWHWSATFVSADKDANQDVTSADEPVTVNKAAPTISTVPSSTSTPPKVGDTLKDTATLSHGYHPTGTITFTLTDPDGKAFGTPEQVTVDGNGDYSTATGYVADKVGTWYWTAAYSGDTNNDPVTSGPTDEPVVIMAGETTTPTITTSPNLRSAPIGALLQDTATLTGNHPGGTITFTLLDPDGHTFGTPEVVPVNHGNGNYSTATGYTVNRLGVWHWTAAYSGDANNDAVTSKPEDEAVTVGQAKPTISTTPSSSSNPAVVGDTLTDTATLSHGYHPTGQITFTLKDPDGNTFGTPETVTVNGNATYTTPTGYVANRAGTWHWIAEYGGDTNNEAVTSGATDEPVVVGEVWHPAQPSITTTPNTTKAVVGTTLTDTATLSGGTHPTNHITFTLFDPAGHVAYTVDVNVDGNNDYSTPEGHVADMVGTWHWTAAYSGDEGNDPVASGAEDERVVIDPASPTITTSPNPTSVTGSATLKDTATLTGGFQPTGKITFTLYDPNDTAVHTEQVDVDGNGAYTTPDGHFANTPGTWHWKAVYSGDDNNLDAASEKADEPVTVTGTGEVLAATASPPAGLPLALLLLLLSGLTAATALAMRRREA